MNEEKEIRDNKEIINSLIGSIESRIKFISDWYRLGEYKACLSNIDKLAEYTRYMKQDVKELMELEGDINDRRK